jgi:hypothetical protein
MDKNIFILRVEISASVRQSTQIKFDDLRLPQSVIDTLEQQQSVSVRPNLSGKLKEFLSDLRIEQRKLYDECTIHQGDTHFLHEDFFEDAMERINNIRQKATEFNKQLCNLWVSEHERWAKTVDGFLEPLFKNEDPEALKMAKDAYLRLFPTKKEFESPINVYVLGPNPAFLDVARNKKDHPLTKAIYEASVANTTEVLEAAKKGAADRACLKAAELLDDLDVRLGTKVGERQTGGSVRRGSWQITAENLRLISSYCPGFENLTILSNELLEIGNQLQSDNAKKKDVAYQKFSDHKIKIRQELENIVATRDSTEGLETLKKSLSLSGTYRDLIAKIETAETEEQLESLSDEIQVEKDVYDQRARHLQNLFDRKTELIRSANVGLAEVLAEIQTINATSTNDLDF